MPTLYEAVLQKKQAGSQIAANPTLDAMDGDYCQQLDSLVSGDEFIADRVAKTLKELELAGGIDYNDHYRNAFDAYNEAVAYHLMKIERGFNVSNIPERAVPTPDFEVDFTFKNSRQEQVMDRAFIEMKSLAFSGGNLQYKQVQINSLESNISLEEQRTRGKQFCSSCYEVSPLGDKGYGITAEIEEIIKKINNNIKREQFLYGNGNDTLLWVDLSQFIFPFQMEECLPAYPDLKRKCTTTGRLWTIAFGEEGDRVFSNCEYEGKGNFDKKLSLPGIMNTHDYIKGMIFCSGTKIGEKRLYGFYRHREEDLTTNVLLYQLCEFCNDDQNSCGFKYFSKL